MELKQLLEEIHNCNHCSLMVDNRNLNIPYVPINPKPDARVVFIGRDPNPNSVKIVGIKEGNSSFIDEINEIASQAGLSPDQFYITDICKCYWKTAGDKTPEILKRSSKIPFSVIKKCFNKWLVHEIQILQPLIIVAFGDEVYQYIKGNIIHPNPVPEKFSSGKMKVLLDVERWLYEHNEFMKICFSNIEYNFTALRHAGSFKRLEKINENDLIFACHRQARQYLINELMKINR